MEKNLPYLKFALVTFFCICLTSQSYSQIDSLVIGKKYKITLSYGFEATGIVRSITDDTVKIETEYKTFSLPRKDISEINGNLVKTIVTDTSYVEYYKEREIVYVADPNESRLFLGPSGKTLKQGDFYLSGAVFFPYFYIPLFFPFGNAGITDYINIEAGASPYPPLFYIAPKIRALHLDNVNVSLGFAYAQTFKFQDVSNDYNIGFIYGVSSFDFEKYYTASVGVGMFYNIDWKNNNKISTLVYPHILLGFEARTAKDFKLISENWINLGSDHGASFSVFSLGGRVIGNHTVLDFTLLGVLTNANPGGSGGKLFFIPMPWISFAYNFSL